MNEQTTLERPRPRSLFSNSGNPAQWWVVVAIGLALFLTYRIATDEISTNAFIYLMGQNSEDLALGEIAFRGVLVTIFVSFVGYLLSLLIGLIVGLGRVSSRTIPYNLATFYVEIIRGIPILVLLIYIAFVGVPFFTSSVNGLGNWLLGMGVDFAQPLADFSNRQVSFMWRAIIGLGIAYGSFMAETFRAGIQSVERGQMEAARALGMSYFQAMRLVILPQAFRRIVPILGNDFVSIVKDSALVSVLGVGDLTQLAKLHASSTFHYFETYSILAFSYLLVTVSLTRGVRWLERRMATEP